MSRFACSLALLALCGCTTVAAPSLAPRPIERRGVFAEPTAAAVTDVVDPAFDAKVAAALAPALAGEADFAAALAAAKRLVPAGESAPAGSDAWVAAQQALTTLDAARGPAAGALATLDDLRLEAAAREAPPATAILDAALNKAGAIESTQRAAYQALATRMPSG